MHGVAIKFNSCFFCNFANGPYVYIYMRIHKQYVVVCRTVFPTPAHCSPKNSTEQTISVSSILIHIFMRNLWLRPPALIQFFRLLFEGKLPLSIASEIETVLLSNV